MSGSFLENLIPQHITLNKYKIYDVYLLLACILLIILYGNILDYIDKEDVLAYKFYDNCNDCDYWGVTHFIFFLSMGLLYPNRHLKFLLLGGAWEVIEGVAGSVEYGDNKFIKLFGGWGKNKEMIKTNDWWYGRMGDIVFNTFGYTIGSYLVS